MQEMSRLAQDKGTCRILKNTERQFLNRNRIELYAQGCVPVSYLSDSAEGQSWYRTVAEQ